MTDEDRTVADLLRSAVDSAVVPSYRRLADHERHEKGPGDAVTAADREAEAIIEAGLRQMAPDSLVVGEEAASAEPAFLERARDHETVWFVDPLDGTNNFAAGIPLFDAMIAKVVGGRTRAAWILDALGGQMAWAGLGTGALLDGERLAVAAPEAPARMEGAIALRFFKGGAAGAIAERFDRVGFVMQPRCAALTYLWLASGRLHYALYRRLYPWDHVAGALLHAEAGGYAAHVDGTAYDPFALPLGQGYLLAPDRALWAALRDALGLAPTP